MVWVEVNCKVEAYKTVVDKPFRLIFKKLLRLRVLLFKIELNCVFMYEGKYIFNELWRWIGKTNNFKLLISPDLWESITKLDSIYVP